MPRKRLKTLTSTAPSYWASYLINGDASGMDDSEIEQCDAWLAWVGAGDPVDCEDDGFRRFHDAAQFGVLAADCSIYTFLKG